MKVKPTNQEVVSGKYSFLDYLLTIPEAQVRIFDLEWQSAFYTVFHQTKTSRLVHAICMAPIVLSLFAIASYINVSSASIITGLSEITQINGAFLMMIIFSLWYIIMDREVGLATIPLLIIFWLFANEFNFIAGNMGVWIAIGVLLFSSFIQTISHQPEMVPPPHSGTDRFMKYSEWKENTTLAHKVKVGIMLPIFTLLELISSPRLLPVQILRLMHKLGYKKDLEKLTEERANRVLKSGNYEDYFAV